MPGQKARKKGLAESPALAGLSVFGLAERLESGCFAIGVPMVSADRSRVLAFNCSGRVSVMTREKLVQDFGPRLVALRDKVLK